VFYLGKEETFCFIIVFWSKSNSPYSTFIKIFALWIEQLNSENRFKRTYLIQVAYWSVIFRKLAPALPPPSHILLIRKTFYFVFSTWKMDFQFVSKVEVDNPVLIERSTAVETNPKYVLTTIQIQMFFLVSCAKQWTGNSQTITT